MKFGIYGLLWAVAIVSYINLIINALVNKMLINYGLIRQLCDTGGCFLLAILAGAAIYGLGLLLPIHPYFIMLIQIVVYVLFYLFLAKCFKMEEYKIYSDILFNMIHRK